MTTITKAYKIKLIKPVGVDEDQWKFIGNILNEMSYMVKRLKNRTATDTFINNVNGMNGIKKKSEAKIKNDVYAELEDLQIRRYGSTTAQGAVKNTYDKVNRDFQKILKGEMSLPNYKDGQPIPIGADQVVLYKENGKYYSKLSLLSLKYAGELGRKGREKARVEFLMSAKGNEKIVMERILSGEYKLCASTIQKQDKHWYLVVVYQFEKENTDDLAYLRTKQEEEFGQVRVLGIDMGIAKAVYMAVSNSPVNAFIDGGEIEQFRNKVEYRRNQMRNQLKWASENRRGHGSQTLLKPLEILESKVSNFRKTTNHRYAKYIVEFAVKNQCSIIQMEELSGINERSAFLKRWSYFDLQTKIESKAKEYGIEVIKVNPKFTSQRCYKCGVINKDNRKSQDKYECECKVRNRKGETVNYKINADLNAARNLSVLGIDDIIYEQALHQGLVKPKEEEKKSKKKVKVLS